MYEAAQTRGATWLDNYAQGRQPGAPKPLLPLPSTLAPVAPFQPDMLPDAISAYVMDVADRQQCPPDFVAVTAICALSALVGRKVLMCPKQRDDWTVTPNQWGAIIGRPSAMKSPSMKAALAPLVRIQQDASDSHNEALQQHKAEQKLAELEKKASEDKAKKLYQQGKREEALAVLTEAEREAPPPGKPRLIVNDATVEKLGELLNENPNGLILVRDELAGWLGKLAQDDYQSDRAFYLECFDGNGRFTYDRIGRGTIEIENCTLSMIGGIQPDKIAPIVRSASNGTANDGLVQRLQLAVWPDDLKQWRWRDRAPKPQARYAYEQTFFRLQGLALETDAEGEPPAWRFTPEAQALFIEWMEVINAEARESDLAPALESHLLKMPQTIAGLALLFELIEGEGGSVGVIAAARALEWADYLKTHAERLYSAATNRGAIGAALIVKRRDKLPNPFTSRDVRRKQWTGLDSTEAVRDALDVLVEHYHLTALEVPTTTKPRTDYHWHPELLPVGEVR